MVYLKALRLNGVRKALSAAERDRMRIIDVAMDWGFEHMGHFAADYRAMFGERPSETPRTRGNSFSGKPALTVDHSPFERSVPDDIADGHLSSRRSLRFAVYALAASPATDPLPSWNDGAAKQAIINFVHVTTDPSSPHFVPVEQRLATFDQDGTLWVEHPIYSQVEFALAESSRSLRSIRSGKQPRRSAPSSPATRPRSRNLRRKIWRP